MAYKRVLPVVFGLTDYRIKRGPGADQLTVREMLWGRQCVLTQRAAGQLGNWLKVQQFFFQSNWAVDFECEVFTRGGEEVGLLVLAKKGLLVVRVIDHSVGYGEMPFNSVARLRRVLGTLEVLSDSQFWQA